MDIKIESIRGQVAVYSLDQVSVRAVVLRQSARRWQLSWDQWQGAPCHCRTALGVYPSQAAAIAQAGRSSQRPSPDLC